MPKLKAPNGSTVNVSEEMAERLLTAGYSKVEQPKATAKKASPKKSD